MTWVRYSLISTTLPRPKATLTRGNDVHAHRRAGDHHSCALQRERRQVGDVRARQKPRQLSRDAHSSASHRRTYMRRSLVASPFVVNAAPGGEGPGVDDRRGAAWTKVMNLDRVDLATATAVGP